MSMNDEFNIQLEPVPPVDSAPTSRTVCVNVKPPDERRGGGCRAPAVSVLLVGGLVVCGQLTSADAQELESKMFSVPNVSQDLEPKPEKWQNCESGQSRQTDICFRLKLPLCIVLFLNKVVFDQVFLSTQGFLLEGTLLVCTVKPIFYFSISNFCRDLDKYNKSVFYFNDFSDKGFFRRRKFAAGVKFVKAAATGVSPRAKEKLKRRTDHALTLPSMSR